MWCALICTILSLLSLCCSSGFSGMNANQMASGVGFELKNRAKRRYKRIGESLREVGLGKLGNRKERKTRENRGKT